MHSIVTPGDTTQSDKPYILTISVFFPVLKAVLISIYYVEMYNHVALSITSLTALACTMDQTIIIKDMHE